MMRALTTTIPPERSTAIDSRESVSPARKWRTDPGNWLVVALGILMLTYLLWLVTGAPGDPGTRIISNVGFLPVMAAGVFLSFRTALSGYVDRATRRAWILIGIGFLLWLAADTLWLFYEARGSLYPSGPIIDMTYIAKFPFFVAGILSFPTIPLARGERLKVWIDAAAIFLGVGAIVWISALLPVYDATGRSLIDTAFWLAHPITHFIIVLAVFSILARRPKAGSTRVLGFIASGLLIVAVTEHFWGVNALSNIGIDYGWYYAAWMFGQTMLAISPQLHYDILRRGLGSSIPGPVAGRIRELVPYASTAVAFGVVLAVLPIAFDGIGFLLLLLVPLTILVVVRNLIALRENAFLQTQQLIRQRDARFAAMVEHSSDIIALSDANLTCRYVSPSCRSVIGIEPNDAVGTNYLYWIEPEDRAKFESAVIRVRQDPAYTALVRYRPVPTNGGRFVLETVISNQLENPDVRGLIMNSRDVTDRVQLEEQLTYQAYHDPLTGLPNRAHFFMQLERAIADASDTSAVAVLLFDLDRFKQINDTYGHDAGDDLLQSVSARVGALLRPSDQLARLGGDEFTVTLVDIPDTDRALDVAKRILASLDEPVQFAGREELITTSIGVVVTTDHQADPDTLVGQADTAMYQAKRGGRARVVMFEDWMDEIEDSEMRVPTRARTPANC